MNTKLKMILLVSAIIVLGAMLLTSCDEPEAPAATIALDKHGAIDMQVSTTHYNGFDVLKVIKIVYDENGNSSTPKFFLDTMRSLPMVKDTLNTGRTFRNSDDEDEDQEIDTIVIHPKNYQIFITVK